MPGRYDEIIDQLANAARPPGASSWGAEELRRVLQRASRLDAAKLALVARKVGIQFDDDPESVEEFLEVLDEADDKEKLKRVLSDFGV